MMKTPATMEKHPSLGDVVLYTDQKGQDWPAMVVFVVTSQVVDLRVFNNSETPTQVHYNVYREIDNKAHSWRPRY